MVEEIIGKNVGKRENVVAVKRTEESSVSKLAQVSKVMKKSSEGSIKEGGGTVRVKTANVKVRKSKGKVTVVAEIILKKVGENVNCV